MNGELDFVGGEAEGQLGRVSPGKQRLSCVVSASKYCAKAAAGVVVSVTRRVTEPLSLAWVVTARGRIQFASLRTPAAMSGNVAAIRGAWVCFEGEERGA